MKIYTRGGDTGETSLFGGERVRKNAARVAAYGEVDELNSVLGVARAELGHADLCAKLETIQSSLFDLGGELATPGIAERAARGKAGPRVAERDVTELESWIDQLETELEPLRNFILPGGARAAALLHLGRTVCRRAERAVISLAEHESLEPLLVRYLNRLSDFLFVLARVVNRRAGVAEPQWIGRER
jgi:cob(I)alamin adenosyltransferase